VRFTETRLPGVWIVDIEPLTDERGYFARTFCVREMAERGLRTDVAQCSFSVNRKRGTLRGMHWQEAPYAESKLVRCTRGAILDVALDVRPDSPAYGEWISAELTAQNHRALYIPEGVAHGFQALEDDTEVFYQIGEFHHPEAARGVRFDDPAFGIRWPIAEAIVSDRDRRWALVEPVRRQA
jgi:dTDP-4-dehydrorhamnose 3,5-epimerase